MSEITSKSLTIHTSVQYVKGIGPKRAALLRGAGVETVEDLLYYFPRRYLDRSNICKIGDLRPDQIVTVVARVFSAEVRRGRRNRFMLLVSDGTGFLTCVWFQGISYISRIFQVGDTVAFSGKVTVYRGPQLVHPDFDKISEEGETDPLHTGGIVPLYPSTEALSRGGLDSRGFRRILKTVTEAIPGFVEETLPGDILESRSLMPLSQALKHIHFPADTELLNRARKRLKFEELFFIQLFLALQRHQHQHEKKGITFSQPGVLNTKFISNLPFLLTGAQKRVLDEIICDMMSDRPMNRLLQGDVGSGKTVVATAAMLIAVANGYQAAMMAPTEILAEQHYLTIHEWLVPMGLNVSLLRGSMKPGRRREVVDAVGDGSIHVIVGTHALVQESVNFHQLGLVVIDEQHRFGVMQRATLQKKGMSPDVLIMTATPIPRTLALTLYGDLDVSVIDELPPGRKPVRTVWRTENKREAIYDFIREEAGKGHQIYIIYPLVEESEKVDLAAAAKGYETLSENVFTDLNLALLHGRMKPEEKEAVMNAFKAGDIDILVSTTVIEVGVDVPNATLMLVEHAERFGLTQLHQLRGRVGRNSSQSTCVLLAKYPMSDDARKRLDIMTGTSDGFRIAEADLEMRGPGELFGTRQHGTLMLKIANLATDGMVVEEARKAAFHVVENDPDLASGQHMHLKQAYERHYRTQFGLIAVG